ncbi:MAG TPA: SRPBCC family protein [Gaiellaceae bacterium]|nr:SRPBCC family protein [Gaiellaceae bacterium]
MLGAHRSRAHAPFDTHANPEGGSMPKIADSIEVQVPVEQAYNQWTQFEEFPKFMEGIQSVQQLDDTHVQWVAQIRGESRQWTSEITEQAPDERIAWKTIDGAVKNDGVVTFEQVGDGLTRINLEMDVEGESTGENVAGDLLGVVKGQVHGDLERFKRLIESRNEETGAWRGEVQDGDTK